MYRILKLMEPRSGMHFMVNGWGHGYSYYAVENVNCIDCCGYVMRGSIAGNTSTYFRARNTTFTDYCEDVEGEVTGGVNSATGVKIWGNREGMEWLYNDWNFDSGDQYTTNGQSCGGSAYAIVDNCQRDVYILGNKVTNVGAAAVFSGGLERGCQQQNADNLHFGYNYVSYTDDNCVDYYVSPIQFETSLDDPEWFSEDKYAYNNFVADLTEVGYGISSGIFMKDGVPPEVACVALEDPWECCTGVGTGCTFADPADVAAVQHVAVNNTFYSDDWKATSAGGGIYVGIGSDLPNDWVLANNLFLGESTNPSYWMAYYVDSVDDLTSDNNIWAVDANHRYYWVNTLYGTLPLFAAESGTDSNSKGEDQDFCIPVTVNAPTDLHLDTTDTCAQEAGSSQSGYITDDYDFEARPQSTFWDVGADEYASGYTPEGACCTAGACSITTEAACSGGTWQGAGTDCDPNPCVPPEGAEVSGFAEGVSLDGVQQQ
jgi:hypothetical protein